MSTENKIELPQFLLIAGQGQNVGKTLLAGQIIQHFSRQKNIVYLKISPHLHHFVGETLLIDQDNSWQLHEDRQTNLNKDTHRMLKAGAANSYLLLAADDGLKAGLECVLDRIPQGNPVVCESGGLFKIVRPGIFLYLRQLNCRIDGNEDLTLADRIVTYTVNGFDFSIMDIVLDNNNWSLKEDL